MYATGVGSLPGKDFPGAVQHVLGSFEHAWLPELPARGVGADMAGRTLAMVDGLAFDLQPQGWRLGEHSGVDHERARSILRRDLDDLEEHAQAFTGTVTLTATGPWTLAALLERPRGDKVLADHGARREVAEALGGGLASLLAELHRRLPAVRLAVQLDEPMLPAVMGGRVATASGFSRLRAVDRPVVADLLQRVTAPVRAALTTGEDPRTDDVLLHCCAAGLDLDLVGRAGITAVGLDVGTLTARDLDAVAGWLEAGRHLRLGLADTATPDVVARPDAIVSRGLGLLRPLGLDPDLLVAGLSVSTACGLAGWQVGPAMRQLDALLEAAPLLAEQLAR